MNRMYCTKNLNLLFDIKLLAISTKKPPFPYSESRGNMKVLQVCIQNLTRVYSNQFQIIECTKAQKDCVNTTDNRNTMIYDKTIRPSA